MKVFNQVDFNEWQEIADKCAYATFFHTPTWSKVFAETYPEMEIATKKFVLDDGTRVILPLMKTKAMRGLFSTYVSGAPGVPGGIISDRKIKEAGINEIFTSLPKGNIANILVIGNPLFDYYLPKQFKMEEDFTQIIRLDKNEKEIWADYTYSGRNKISKARRAGVKCIEASNFDEWKEYYSIYQEALKDMGLEPLAIILFLYLRRCLKQKIQI